MGWDGMKMETEMEGWSYVMSRDAVTTPQIIRTAQYRAVQNSRIVDVSNAHAPSGILPRDCRAFDPWFVHGHQDPRFGRQEVEESKRERKKRKKVRRRRRSTEYLRTGVSLPIRFLAWSSPAFSPTPILSRSPLFPYLAQSLPTQRKRRLD